MKGISRQEEAILKIRSDQLNRKLNVSLIMAPSSAGRCSDFELRKRNHKCIECVSAKSVEEFMRIWAKSWNLEEF